jgi:CMP-N-acetylneuraminic acid synthetase|tara:strand:+ start:387 stop:1109 length:723 start_codon:yes stop_codon:yes gene_type:complete
MSDITALIMVRSGSVRCKNKNIRRFADTSLLENKIKTLKQVNGLGDIVVSSNCPIMLTIAKKFGAIPVKRDEEFATSETHPRDLYKNVAECISTPHVLSASVCYPMMTVDTYNNLIESFNKGNHESVVACHSVKHHMWINSEHGYEPLNYEPGSQPNSQELPEVVSVCWGGIVTKTDIMKTGELIGRKPCFYEVSEYEAVDIDTELDFKVSETIYKSVNGLVGGECTCKRKGGCCKARKQ